MDDSLVPVAQYLRMSTENQQYSLANQADAISRYAAEHGFRIVKTYSDAARSGLRLKKPPRPETAFEACRRGPPQLSGRLGV
jgi:DNA invertase Pin-like site-specific DNA recombinase